MSAGATEGCLELGADELDGDVAVDEETAAQARDLCARLISETAVPRDEAPELETDRGLRREVQRRLDAVGLQLVTSWFAGVYAVRLAVEVAADPSLAWSVNRRLPRGAVAVLVALWARLVLPRRALMERREQLEEGADLFGGEAPPVRPDLFVHRDALLAELGPKLGRTNVQRYVGMLRNAGYVEIGHDGAVREGPLMDVLIDGDEMALKLRDSVLRDVLDEVADDGAEQSDLPMGAAAQVVDD